jgi:hypothetical protein
MWPKSQRTFMEEFIPKIGSYLSCLLDSEGVPATTMCRSCKSTPFEWKCADCFPALLLCNECCRNLHQRLPFHRVQKWTGKFFIPSWLREVGISLHLGHSGDSCPFRSVCRQLFHSLNDIIYTYSYRTTTTTIRLGATMTMIELPTLALVAQNLGAAIKMEILS